MSLSTALEEKLNISGDEEKQLSKQSEEDLRLRKDQLLSAARLNNTELMEQLISEVGDHEVLADLINNCVDLLGNTSLHLASKYGSYEVMDIILDQEGVEVDPVNSIEGNTPLHVAVQYSKEEPEHGCFIIETLVDAGADPKLKNKAGLKPIDLVDSNNEEYEKIIDILENAEFANEVEYIPDGVADGQNQQLEGDEGAGEESASDSE